MLPDGHRRLLARSVARSLAIAAALLALYAVLPVPGSTGAAALVELVVGLLFFLALVGWHIRSIVDADHPVMRAIEVVALALSLAIFVFAFTYLTLSQQAPGSFSEDLSRIDSLYYTVSTLSTVGFGDVLPVSDAARILAIVQMLFDLALIAGLVRLVVLATRTGLRRQGIDGELRPGGGE